MFLCLAYPELDSKDRTLIDDFRATHDKSYVHVVEPHWTMIFPVRDLSQARLASHIERVAEQNLPVDFVCRYALVHDDDEKEDFYIFLVPDEGFSQISRIHDDLYSGLMKSYLRLDLPYLPHIGIATNPDSKHLKQLADEWNQKKITISGRIGRLTLSHYDGNIVRDIQQFDLNGSYPDGGINSESLRSSP